MEQQVSNPERASHLNGQHSHNVRVMGVFVSELRRNPAPLPLTCSPSSGVLA